MACGAQQAIVVEKKEFKEALAEEAMPEQEPKPEVAEVVEPGVAPAPADETIRINVSVTNPAGNSIALFPAIDIFNTTGGTLKQMIAKAVGFPAAGIKLSLPTGRCIMNPEALSTMLSSDMLNESELAVSCVLVKSCHVGAQWNGKRRSFGGKSGMMLARAIRLAEQRGKPIVSNLRSPNGALRNDVHELITESFAPGLRGLIELALQVAHQPPAGDGLDSTDSRQKLVFEDAERGAYADLSTCQLWTRAFHANKSIHDPSVVSAVLWRLLFNWEGSPAVDGPVPDGPVRAGPVLEVLFLATNPEFRDEGEGQKLVAELEDAARGLGCVAMCVAAVPKQGIAFWKRAQFEVAVPLAAETGEGPGEPVTVLGQFLVENMLLFSDTPLLAKVFDDKPVEQGSS